MMYTTKENEQKLAEQIRRYWLNQGYLGIRTWVESTPTDRLGSVWCVRSNIGGRGFPPREREDLAA